MKFYILHSYIIHGSCTVESERFTAPLKYHLSLIQIDALVCCFRDAEVLHFTVSFSLKLLE